MDIEAQVASYVAELRKSFSHRIPQTLEHRKSQLDAFKLMLDENEDKFREALWKDLHKNSVEADMMEIAMVQKEAQCHIDHVEEWMSPTKVSTDPLNFPGWSEIRYDPLGVVLVVGAWNYPVQLSLLPCIGAISAGNSVCLKLPSDKYSKHVSKIIAELIPQYMDPRTFKVVSGDRRATQAVLQQSYEKMFFTGGAFVGKMVAESAAKNLTPTVLELGGKSPCIVDKTADITITAKRMVWGRFANAGQTCVAPDYCMVHEDIADEFVEEVKKQLVEMYTDFPQDTEFFGRIINKRAFDGLVKILEKDNKYITYGGERDENDLYISPTVLDFGTDFDAFSNAAAMEDEIFGPILPIYHYSDLNQVLDFIVTRDKPLALYCFTTNSTVRERVLTETSSGGAVINDCLVHLGNEELPFGGVGKSGSGQYHGKYSFECFSHRKSVLMKSNYLDIWARYPPYDSLKKLMLREGNKPITKFQNKVMRWATYGIIGVAIFGRRKILGTYLRKLVDFCCGPAAAL